MAAQNLQANHFNCLLQQNMECDKMTAGKTDGVLDIR